MPPSQAQPPLFRRVTRRVLLSGVSLGCALFMAITLAAAAGDDSGAIKAYRQGDYATAYKLWLSLANKGNNAAQYNIGLLYQHGLGVPRQVSEAVKWYTKAAHGGDADAQATLGDMILEGHWGTGKQTSAVKWYRLAANQGQRKAQRQLGILLSQGTGVKRDTAEAAEWLQAASDQGDAEAARWLRGLDRQRPKQPGKTATASVTRTTRPGRTSRQPNFGSRGKCPSYPKAPYDIHVRLQIPTPPINHKLSIKELGQKTVHGPRSKILGLMQSSLRFNSRGHYNTDKIGNTYCFSVRAIDVTLRYKTLQVYVAREYKRGSCAFRAILSHEKEHVSIARNNMEGFAPDIRAALTSHLIPTGADPVQIENAKEASAKMQSIFTELLEPVYKRMWKALRASQGAIDTPRSYRQVRRRCSRW